MPRRLVASGVATLTALAGLTLVPGAATGAGPAAPGEPGGRYTTKTPTSQGYGGAVTSVDPEASRVGIEVLRKGGNAVDAAVATAAALGVTEPYSAGIGGGGYFVHYDARSGKVETIDGRETAPAAMPPTAMDGYPFAQLVSSGLSVGTPGTLATWERALQRWGSRSLAESLRPASQLARRGFTVDQTFHDQTNDNVARFAQFPETSRLFLPGGAAPAVGSVFKNKDLAATYDLIARQGTRAFYSGPLAQQIAQTVQRPPKSANATLPAPGGYLEARDLAGYRVSDQAPTRSTYRGYDVYGMAPSSSGGTTVGEALNILETVDLGSMTTAQALHHYLEASALAFADRGKYVGDPRFVDVPVADLLSDAFGAERACEIDPATTLQKPVAPGDVTAYDGRCDDATAPAETEKDTENISTTNLTATDKWGNVVEYTLTIEQTGGSGITVPGRGFLLNNELTDFNLPYKAGEANAPAPGKRPRSSMAPTIVVKDGKPVLALGSPGGSTIITTVLQMLVNRLDLGMTLPQAIAAPRASQRNATPAPGQREVTTAEPEFITAYKGVLEPLGHVLVPAGDAFTSAAQIGAATAIEVGPNGLLTAVSEPVRRGGGSALVVHPGPRR